MLHSRGEHWSVRREGKLPPLHLCDTNKEFGTYTTIKKKETININVSFVSVKGHLFIRPTQLWPFYLSWDSSLCMFSLAFLPDFRSPNEE